MNKNNKKLIYLIYLFNFKCIFLLKVTSRRGGQIHVQWYQQFKNILKTNLDPKVVSWSRIGPTPI